MSKTSSMIAIRLLEGICFSYSMFKSFTSVHLSSMQLAIPIPGITRQHEIYPRNPQKTHRWKLKQAPLGKGKTSTKHQLWGSMFVFGASYNLPCMWPALVCLRCWKNGQQRSNNDLKLGWAILSVVLKKIEMTGITQN